jgi:hypothetical protein
MFKQCKESRQISSFQNFLFNLRANFGFYELLPLANRSLFPSGSNGKLIFALRVFALRAILDKRIKLVNRGINVYFMIHLYNSQAVRWNSSVTKITSYCLKHRGSFPRRDTIYLFTTISRLEMGPTKSLIWWVPGVKLSEREANYSHSPNTKVKNVRSFTSTLPVCLHGAVLRNKVNYVVRFIISIYIVRNVILWFAYGRSRVPMSDRRPTIMSSLSWPRQANARKVFFFFEQATKPFLKSVLNSWSSSYYITFAVQTASSNDL